MRWSGPAVLLLLSLSEAACHGGGAAPPPPLPPAPTPATTPSQPASRAPVIVPNQGGPTLKHVSVVSVVWAEDPLQTELADFDRWMVGSGYWSTGVAEYGLGPGEHAGVFVVPGAAPTDLTYAALTQILQDALSSGALPGITPDRLYTVYPPPGTKVDGAECSAYHASVSTDDGDAIYAITSGCAGQGFDRLQATTWAASHEILEAATDPSPPLGSTGYQFAWRIGALDSLGPSLPNGGELGDLCEGQPRTVEGHTVSAIYSNVAAAAGRRPCLPSPDGPMFHAWPSQLSLPVARGSTVTTTLAIAVSPAEPVTLSVDAFNPDVRITTGASQVVDGTNVTVTVEVPVTVSTGKVPVVATVRDATYSNYDYLELDVR